MKEVYDLFLIFPDDAVGWVLFVFSWILLLCVSIMTIGGILHGINYGFLSERYGELKIVKVVYEPRSVSTIYIYNVVTKTPMPHTMVKPDSWYIVFERDGLTDNYTISEKQYHEYKNSKGLAVVGTYGIGRLWGGLYVKKVKL